MFDRFYGLCRRIPGESRFVEVSRDIKSEILNPENYHLYGDTVCILEKSVKLGYRNYILSNNYPELEE